MTPNQADAADRLNRHLVCIRKPRVGSVGH